MNELICDEPIIEWERLLKMLNVWGWSTQRHGIQWLIEVSQLQCINRKTNVSIWSFKTIHRGDFIIRKMQNYFDFKEDTFKLIFDVNYRITEYIKYLTKNIDVKMKICWMKGAYRFQFDIWILSVTINNNSLILWGVLGINF